MCGVAVLAALAARALAAAPETAAAAHSLDWGKGIRVLGWTAAATLLLFGLVQLLRRWFGAALRARELEEEEWSLEERYPYCTEPHEEEPLVIDLHEPVELSLGLLRQLEWRRFEELVCGYFDARGFEAQSTRVGGVTGVDVYLYRPGEHRPFACVQAKSLVDRAGARRALRELGAAIVNESAEQGFLVTASRLPPELVESIEGKPIVLIDGSEFVGLFGELRVEDRDRILRHVLRGDYRTPTCPNCGVKMVAETREGRSHWRCANYPRCQRRIVVRAVE